VRLAALAAAAFLLAGCTADPFVSSEPGSVDSGSATTQPAQAVSLTITVWPNGRGEPVYHATLECDPIGGNHPLPEAACASVRTNPTALAPVRPDLSCTQEYGGPDRARVEGVVDGVPVSAELTRTDGCQIARWDSLAPLFKIVVR